MSPVPRPTFRCLRSDLNDGWADSSHQKIAGSYGPTGPPPLHGLDHPLIRHVVEVFGESDESIRRETISASSDPKVFKAKSGRWRGAVYIDPEDGQQWLVAAGLRREGEDSDFYAAFGAAVSTYGSDWFLPTDEDRARLHEERVSEQLNRWETDVHNKTLDALAQADANQSAAWELLSFNGSETIAAFTLKVEIIVGEEEDEPDGYGEITIIVEVKDYRHLGLIDHAEIIAMCAIDPREASWTAGHTTNRIYSMCDSAKQIADVITAATSNENLHPRTVQPGSVAHYACKQRLTEQYIEGQPTKSLCGSIFVPRQDPNNLPKCPECEGIYRSMGSLEA
ncbi:DUF3039 domain-containing protein [Mycobacterium marinum]|uniref:DUF3039 domain-containing protein n=1 Tax=Mycobacterium marinum TaxID=1781 RepID=UPI0021C37C50|nr:DUF3039 domain-containing protein [Mycobacterium marinum]